MLVFIIGKFQFGYHLVKSIVLYAAYKPVSIINTLFEELTVKITSVINNYSVLWIAKSVPLNKIAKEILAKYADFEGKTLLPYITKQDYNEAIKEMFTIAKLTRPVVIPDSLTRESVIRPLNAIASSHLARRSFVGNLYKQVKDPNLIGALSGHREGSKAFARYRAIDEQMKQELVKMLE